MMGITMLNHGLKRASITASKLGRPDSSSVDLV
jgi:hypothetical protein